MSLPTSKPRFIALIVASATFMAQLDAAVVTLLLPAMGRSFHSTAIEASHGITAYLLIQVALLPASGWIADRFGARRVFALAIVGFTIASMLCAGCRSLPEFVAARMLQGSAAALMSPVGRVLLLSATRKEDLASVMNVSTIPMLLAPSVGPVLGAYIGTYLSWPWIFLINVPIGVTGLLLTMRFIPPSDGSQCAPFDVKGFILFGGSLTMAIEAMEMFGSARRHWPLPVALFLTSCGLGLAAVLHVRRHHNPILSWSVTRVPTYFVGTLSGGAVMRVPLRALSFILPLMFQTALGFSVIQSGWLLMVMSGSDLVIKTVTLRTLRRFGFRHVLITTAILSAVTMAAYALLSPTTPLPAVVAVLFVGGALRSLLFSGSSALSLADIPRAQLNGASVLWTVMLQVTNSIAVALSAIALQMGSTIVDDVPGRLSLEDFHRTLILMAVIALSSVPSFWMMRPDAGSQTSGHRANG